ncbi:hypothetical protein [Citrobacter portucalensis]|uniref:hypothetical protein n=1 Tax=Citrobacter portucalensis TaxID=1639133 RepID=UPI00301D7869
MKVCSDDYIVIDKYSNGDPAWIGRVETDEKRKNLIRFSWEVAAVFIQMVRYYGDSSRSEEGKH